MFDVGKKFQVSIQGRGTLQLGPNDHVATGGEGHVYRKGGLAVKIWDDPARAATGRMPEKIVLLAKLAHRCVVAPEALAMDAGGKAIGYSMPWVDGSWAMPMAFTNDWRAANGFSDADALAFASRMREVVTFVHGHGAVMGDANELNVLGVGVGAACEPRYIDVDPWVLPGFPGDKILPTILDHHAKPFSREADWFAWAVTTFQLMVGVHPYRGTHPGYKRNDLEGRMKANASVFDRDVRLSPAARPMDRIPGPLLDWYAAVFRDGFRGLPPDPAAVPTRAPARTQRARTVVGGDVSVADLYALKAAAVRTVAPDVLLTEGGMLLSLSDGREFGRADPGASFARLPDGTLAVALARRGRVEFGVLRATPGAVAAMSDTGIAATSAWAAGNRLFAIVTDGILELQPREMGGRHQALVGRKWGLNANSTFFGDGASVYDALGAKFLVAPFGTGAVAIVRSRELDGLKPLAVTRRDRVAVMSLIDAAGGYKRAVALFAQDFASVQVTVSDADDGDLGDVVTDAGVVVRIDGDGKLELTVPTSGERRIADPGAAAVGKLLAGPSGVFLAEGGRVAKVTLR